MGGALAVTPSGLAVRPAAPGDLPAVRELRRFPYWLVIQP